MSDDNSLLPLNRTGTDRQTLIAQHTDLTKQVKQLRTELSAYSEQDPVEMEKKRAKTQSFWSEAEKYTDQILGMEGWLKGKLGGDTEQLDHVRRMLYGDEYDEEEGGLREL